MSGLVLLAMLAAGGCRFAALQVEGAAPPYQLNAGGKPAAIDSAIALTFPGLEGSGLILNAEICGGEVYLLAPANKYVQIGDLASGVVRRHIGKPGNGPEDFRRPVSLGVDCSARRVYVAEGKGGVLAFSMENGQYQHTYPHAAEFRTSMGTRTVVAADGSTLILSGLWSPEPGRSWAAGNGMFRGHQVGLQLHFGDPVGHTVTAAYERDCNADLTACLRADVQPIDAGDGWVAAHASSTRIAVLDSRGMMLRAIDIRSPEFLRDGTIPDEATEDQLKWGTTNSTIWGLYAIGDRIAVIHARNASKNWQRGQVVQFDVFMNLYGLNGDRLVSDIRLPGLPVGRYGEHLLVIDYGSAGRRRDATQVTLARIPLRGGALASK